MTSACLYVGWTKERTDECLRLWLEGLSASQVARQLGGVSRNAVIGKVYRAKLTGRARPSPPGKAMRQAPPRRAVYPKAAPKPKPVKEPDPVRDVPILSDDKVFALTPTAIPLIGRPFGTCAWPVGDPQEAADQLCCGAQRTSGRPYCAEHARAGQMKNGYGIYSPGADALMRLAKKYAA